VNIIFFKGRKKFYYHSRFMLAAPRIRLERRSRDDDLRERLPLLPLSLPLPCRSAGDRRDRQVHRLTIARRRGSAGVSPSRIELRARASRSAMSHARKVERARREAAGGGGRWRAVCSPIQRRECPENFLSGTIGGCVGWEGAAFTRRGQKFSSLGLPRARARTSSAAADKGLADSRRVRQSTALSPSLSLSLTLCERDRGRSRILMQRWLESKQRRCTAALRDLRHFRDKRCTPYRSFASVCFGTPRCCAKKHSNGGTSRIRARVSAPRPSGVDEVESVQ